MRNKIANIVNKGMLCEVFNSIQGEGAYTGHPMTFVRFNACNKKCVFCDTDFSKMCTDIPSDIMRNICLTGGEPLLFAEEILRICDHKEHIFFGETNGSIFNATLANSIIWAVSPKDLEDIDNVRKFMYYNNKSFIKLVYGTSVFNELYKELCKDYRDRLWIQPMTEGNIYTNINEVVDLCMGNELPLSSRTHIHLRLK